MSFTVDVSDFALLESDWASAVSSIGSGLEDVVRSSARSGAAAVKVAAPHRSYALRESVEFFELSSQDLVLDLYCGLGISVEKWVEKGAKSVGVDLIGEAIRCAQFRVPALFFQGRVSERLQQLKEAINTWRALKGGGRLLIFANPPRSGLEPEVLTWINREAIPSKLVYLSCSAGTLGRDLSALSAYGLKRIIPYDFFPQTYHVEALACLELDPSSSHFIASAR